MQNLHSGGMKPRLFYNLYPGLKLECVACGHTNEFRALPQLEYWNNSLPCPPWCDSSVECSTTDKSGLGQGVMEYWLKASLKLKVPGVS